MKSVIKIINFIFIIINSILGFLAGKGDIETKYFIMGIVLMIIVDMGLFFMSRVSDRED